MDNPNRYAIWGCAGHAKVLSEIISLNGGRVISLHDNNEVESVLQGVPVFFGEAGFLTWAREQHALTNIAGAAAIGGSRGRDRLAVFTLFRSVGITIPSLVHPAAVISPTAHIGSGSQVLALANVAANARIGEGCIINHRASVDHDCELGDGVHLAPNATLCGNVKICNNVFVGAGAVILPRLSIGEGTIIGAGAVVIRDLPPQVTVVGNPAKQIQPKKEKA